MKKALKMLSFFCMTTLVLCCLFSMLRFMGMSFLIAVPSGQDFLTDLKINLIVSSIISTYVVFKEIDKDVF